MANILDAAIHNIQSAAGTLFGNAGNEVQHIGSQAANYFNPTSNNGNNFWSTPVASVMAGQTQLPKVNIQPIANNIQNPILRTGAQLGLGTADSLLNTPRNLVQAPINIARDVNTGATPQQYLADAAPFAEGALNIGTLGGGSVVKGVAEQGIKEGLLQGAKTGLTQGAKYGALYGGLGGLESGRNMTNPQQYAQNLALNTGAGAVGGAAIGGALGGVTGLPRTVVTQTIGKLFPKDTPQQVAQKTDQYLQRTFTRDGVGRFMKPDETPFIPAGGKGYAVPKNQPIKVTQGGETIGWMNRVDQEIKDNLPQPGLSLKVVNSKQSSAMPTAKRLDTELNGAPPTPKEQAAIKDFETNVLGQGKLPTIGPDSAPQPVLPRQKLQLRQNPHVPEPELPPNSTVQDAIAARSGIKTQITERANAVKRIVDNAIDTGAPQQAGESATNYGETKLFRNALEHPENLEANAAQAQNPEAFKTAVGEFSKFTDYVYQLAKKNGTDLNFVKEYYSHILDLSAPEDKAKFDELMAQRNARGYFTKERIFNSIEELEQAGLKLKNPNAPLDIQHYANSAIRTIGSKAMLRGMQAAVPESVVDMSKVGGVPPGFRALTIPGLEGTAVKRDLYAQVKHLEPAPDKNSIVALADNANQTLKNVTLAGGGFHALKTTLRQIGIQTMNLRMPRLDEAFLSSVSDTARLARDQKYIANGTVDKAAQMGVTLEGANDVGEMKGIGEKLNIADKLHQSLFQGLIKSYKLQLVHDANINGMSPEETRQLGAQINNLMGGLNLDLIRRSPITQQWLRRIALAPDFNEGKLRQVASALKPSIGADANFSRKAIIGEALTVGAIAAIGTKIVSGQFPSLQQALLDPSIPAPFTNTKGQKQVIGLPGSTVADIARLKKDPTTFLQARGSAGIAAGVKLISGKDYYGNPLVKDGQDDNILNRAKALVPNEMPIPVVQAEKLAQGKENLATAALNTAGFRVHTDPNDPTYASQQRYFGAKDAEYKKLTPDQQHLVDAIPKQDPTDPGAKQLKYELIGRDPAVWNYFKNIAVADANGDMNKVDPLYTVPYDQAKAYITYEAQNPGSADKKALLKANPGLAQMLAARSLYFQNNPLPNAQPSGAPIASAYVQQQMNAKNWKDPQVQQYLNANTAYNNQARSQMGLTPIAGGGGFSFGPRPFNGAQKIKSQIRSAVTRTRKYKVKKVKIAKSKKLRVKQPQLAKIQLGGKLKTKKA